jgi:outer membrane lipoprotein SlyB
MSPLILRAFAAFLAVALSLGGLAGCASAPQAPAFTGTGVVLAIVESQQADAAAGMAGAIGGALVGGLLGSQVGGGTGQVIAATTGSVIGSAVGGSAASKASTKLVWQISVRFADGIDRSFTVDQRPDYRPGDQVAVSNGTVSRVR